jgi:AraC-like DNA-binding protein
MTTPTTITRTINLFRDAYQPFESLSDLAGCLLDAAVRGGPFQFASLRLTPVASLCSEALELTSGNSSGSAPAAETIPLHHHGQPIGTLTLAESGNGHDSHVALAHLMERHICRFLIESFAIARSKRDVRLIGASEPLAMVEQFIGKSASSPLPVLIAAAHGSYEERIAHALHYAGTRSDSTFVEIPCATAEPADLEFLVEPPGDSRMDVFLRDIDHLDPRLQRSLAGYMELLLSRRSTNLRLIASTTADLHALAGSAQFDPGLLKSFDYLQIRLAPLCERREDIGPLALKFLRKHSLVTRGISPDALAALTAYSWPENVSEVERTMGRLAVMTDGPLVTLDDLRHHAPRVLNASSPRLATEVEPGLFATTASILEPPALIRGLLRGEITRELEMLHPALARALSFIASRSSDHVTLPELARAANISPSHLSSLFRSNLRITFKDALALFRTERAKEMMLRDRGSSLGDIAEQLGFQDPRHFQRIFKRLVGCTPSHFRRRNSASYLIPAVSSRTVA